MEKPTHLPRPVPLLHENSLSTLVENRSAFTLDNCELNVFETHEKAEKVQLVFDDLVLTSMLQGKKVMKLFDKPGFEYLPGQSVIVPPNEVMTIDFPEADWQNPTQCIALAISKEQIQHTLSLLNEHFPKAEKDQQWKLHHDMFHLLHTQELNDIINRFIKISINDTSKEKDLLASLALRELLIRLMQTQAREFFQHNYLKLASSHRFAHVIQYIKENIREKLEVEKLSEKACMSRANFFRKFKEEFGIAPADFILKERLKLAKEYLLQPDNSVTQVCYMAGFQNLHYFIRAFKKEVGVTPKVYQQQQVSA